MIANRGIHIIKRDIDQVAADDIHVGDGFQEEVFYIVEIAMDIRAINQLHTAYFRINFRAATTPASTSKNAIAAYRITSPYSEYNVVWFREKSRSPTR